jgi:hypothetical protein
MTLHAHHRPIANSAVNAAEERLIIYSYSPVFYWWPVWVAGFIFALVTYLDGGRLMWVPQGAEARRDWVVQSAGGDTEAREGIVLPAEKHLYPTHPEEPDQPLGPPNQPHVRLARHKYLGFVFAIVLCFVYFHSNVLWRGFRAYFFLASGVGLLLLLVTVHLLLPGWHVLWWARHVIYTLPDIYISFDGYLFIASALFLIWLFMTFVYSRLTYMEIEFGQLKMVEEIGEGEVVYDTTNMTFEKEKEDLFRHHFLGLGFLRPLRLLVPKGLACRVGLSHMTGTGDLVVRVGGDSGRVISWPNVLNVDGKLERITMLVRSRPVVEEE